MVGEDAGEVLVVAEDVTGPLVLDFSDLQSADMNGLEAIRQLVHKGAKIGQVHGYLRFQLASEGIHTHEESDTSHTKTGKQCKPDRE
jgi:hypothetical protein